MKPIFDELIQPMMQTFAVDLIAEIISSERDNQVQIARKLSLIHISLLLMLLSVVMS